MKKITGDEPAMPSSVCCNENGIYTAGDTSDGGNGLTIREQFAMAAMQGMIAGHYVGNQIKDDVEIAVQYADALINQLNK